ncbi:unnamed protein product [Colias eurytheme]|nr:unnamed protein product [Colias eurytheme]
MRVGTPEGYREAETLRMTDRLSKRRGSEFPQPVSTPPHQTLTKRRQSTAQIKYQEEKPERIEVQKKEERKIMEKTKEIQEDNWKPDPDTIRVSKGQESPAKRLRQEAEPLKRANEARLSQAAPTRVTQTQVPQAQVPQVPQSQVTQTQVPLAQVPQTKVPQSQVPQTPYVPQVPTTRAHAHPPHHKSSPNVAARKSESASTREERKSYTRDSKRQDSDRKMYTASSESELFEYAILPIFQKLLTERHKSQPHGLNLSYGVSCPNISIKCDIVEYL